MEQVIVLCSVGFCIVEGELQTQVGNIQGQAAMWLSNNYCITYMQCCTACCNCVRDNVTVQGKINCKENGYITLSYVRLEKYNI